MYSHKSLPCMAIITNPLISPTFTKRKTNISSGFFAMDAIHHKFAVDLRRKSTSMEPKKLDTEKKYLQ